MIFQCDGKGHGKSSAGILFSAQDVCNRIAAFLAMDHGDILLSARAYSVKELPHTPIVSNLLPTQFTLPDLKALMEAILHRNIDRPNFMRKILSTGMLEKVGLDNTGNRRPADIYRFKYGKNTTLMDKFRFGF